MCGESNVEVGFTCENGHITCLQCASVGIRQCHHHFCADSEIYFEPGMKDLVEIDREELERLQEIAGRPVRIVPVDRREYDNVPIQPWRYTPAPRPIPDYGVTTDGANTNYTLWSTSANADDY